MSKSQHAFICEICGRMISFSEQNSHRLNCRQNPNDKRPSPEIRLKNTSKSKEHINTIPLNYQAFSIDINSQVSCINLDFFRENTINFTSEEKLSDDGIMNVKNLNANYFINQNFPDDVNYVNINTASILESFIINYNAVDTSILDKLNVNEIKDLNAINILNSKCVICLQDYILGDKYIILPCIHSYHEECIKHWLKINNRCPTCNYVISPDDIR